MEENDNESDTRDLELEFETARATALERIRLKLAESEHALSAAQEISEQTGIPFDSPVFRKRSSYIPKSLEDKFGDLDEEFLQNHVRYHFFEEGIFYPGWMHSSDMC